MSYTPKTWECGETITADALNHIEQGIASSGGGTEPLIVNVDIDANPPILDKTFGEIRQAFNSGRTVLIKQQWSNVAASGEDVQAVVYVTYSIGSANAQGEVVVETQNGPSSYSATVNSSPYTLEALDATYPYMSN